MGNRRSKATWRQKIVSTAKEAGKIHTDFLKKLHKNFLKGDSNFFFKVRKMDGS